MLWYLNIILEALCLWLLCRASWSGYNQTKMWSLRVFFCLLLVLDTASVWAIRAPVFYSYFYWAGQSLTYLVLMAATMQLAFKSVTGYCEIGRVKDFAKIWCIGLSIVLACAVGDTWLRHGDQLKLGVVAGILCGVSNIVAITLPRREPWKLFFVWCGLSAWAVMMIVCSMGWVSFDMYPLLSAICLVIFTGALIRPLHYRGTAKDQFERMFGPVSGHNTLLYKPHE